MTPPPSAALGIGFMLLSMLVFAVMDGFSKLLTADYGTIQIIWVRYWVFLAFAVVIAGRRGLWRALRSNRPGLQALRAALLVGEVSCFVFAFSYLPLADVHAIAAIGPLIVTALSVPLLGERVGARRWAAVGAGFLGVLIILRPGFATVSWPLLVPLAAAFLFGLYQVLVRKVSETDPPETTLLYTALVGALLVSVVAPFTWRPPDTQGWALLMVTGLLGAAAHLALIKALQHAQASMLQPYSYTLLLWATVVGLIIFGDFPDGWTLAGGAVVVLSGLYAFYREAGARPEQDAAR